MIRILVVEDSSAMRSYVRAILENSAELEELDVVDASSAFDAMRLLPRATYDLVITDINMPDINGLELLKFVRENERHRGVAVLIISTQSSDRDRARALALGADLYLAKPFSPEELRTAVATTLAGRLGAPAAGDGSACPEGATHREPS